MIDSKNLPDIRHTEASVSRPGVLTIIAGPTASGKSKVQEGVLARYPMMKKVISTTTRPPREGEVDGVDYHFLNIETFKKNVQEGGFLEVELYGNNYYGTQIRDIEPVLTGQDLVWVINMGRAIEIEDFYHSAFNPDMAKAFADRTLLVLIGTPNIQNLRTRFKKRKSADNFIIRMQEDWEVWKSFPEKFPHVVMNNDGELDTTVENVAQLIEERRARLEEHISTD